MPFTSAERWLRDTATTVSFEQGDFGFARACAVLAHQVTTIDKSNIIPPRVGVLSAARMRAVEEALRNYLGLSH